MPYQKNVSFDRKIRIRQVPSIGDLSEEEKITYYQTKELFAMLSNNLDKGTSTINLMSDNFEKGTDKLAYLGEMSKTTDKILK